LKKKNVVKNVEQNETSNTIFKFKDGRDFTGGAKTICFFLADNKKA
jgi:hypothetical protein